MELPEIPPVHPGEILREEFLVPLGWNAADLAARLGALEREVELLLAEKARITPDTALCLSKCLGTSAEIWLNLQTAYDLKIKAAGDAKAD